MAKERKRNGRLVGLAAQACAAACAVCLAATLGLFASSSWAFADDDDPSGDVAATVGDGGANTGETPSSSGGDDGASVDSGTSDSSANPANPNGESADDPANTPNPGTPGGSETPDDSGDGTTDDPGDGTTDNPGDGTSDSPDNPDAPGTSDNPEDPAASDDPDNPGGFSPTTLINNVWIVGRDTDRPVYGYADNPNLTDLTITAKGGILKFDSIIRWDSDWSRDRNTAYVHWSTSNPEVATIAGGDLTAHANGTVYVYATVSGIYTVTGEDMVASCKVEVMGQDEAPYVTKLRIVNSDGSAIDGPVVIESDLSVAFEVFYCEVTVVNPVTGETSIYSTMDGPISEQTGGAVGDIKWSVGDAAVGSVDEDLGWSRPSRYGAATLWATSAAGFGGSYVRESITVTIKDPDAGLHSDGYFPQSALTIKAYYELYPPSEYGNSAYVVDYTFSLDELRALGLFESTYTATGGGSYWTFSGRGVLLSAVLRCVGINISGVYQFYFGTADNLDRGVSPNFVFATNRYYFPNIDIGSYAGAVQVAPMLAFVSADNRNGSTAPDYAHMEENTRFRLLFGATMDPNAGNLSYQIKWINTIYVVLKGGPAYEEGDGDGDGDGEGDGSGSGGGTIEQGGSDDTGGTFGDESSEGIMPAEEGTTSPEEVPTNGVYARPGTQSGGRSSVYQVMNPNDSDVDFNIEEPEFLKKYGLPCALAVLLLGGAQCALWFRRQSKALTVGA